MRGWRTPRRTSAPWSPMKSNNKGPQMSRMGQGALGPEGKRAADVQSKMKHFMDLHVMGHANLLCIDQILVYVLRYSI